MNTNEERRLTAHIDTDAPAKAPVPVAVQAEASPYDKFGGIARG